MILSATTTAIVRRLNRTYNQREEILPMTTGLENSEAAKQGDKKVVTIIVNGTEEEVPKGHTTYDAIAMIGVSLGLPTGPNILYTITYRKADSKPHEGDLAQGGSVEVKEGTVFNVTATDKS